MPIALAPSILSADFGRLAEEAKAVAAAGADLLHVDVMDGRFVPEITLGPAAVEALRRAIQVPLDVHLMIEEPERQLERFIRAGASIVSVHVEACRHLQRTLQQIRALGARPAVALNPATPLESIEWVLEDIDLVLLMTVNPGYGGQSFLESMLPKIRALAERVTARGLPLEIEVDGGIKIENVERVAAAGARVLVAGSGIFHAAQGYAQAMQAMRQRAESAVDLRV